MITPDFDFDINNYISWYFVIAVVAGGQLIKYGLGLLPSYKRHLPPMQKEINKWCIFIYSTALGVFSWWWLQQHHDSYTEERIIQMHFKYFISYCLSTTCYQLAFKYLVNKLKNKLPS